MPVVPPHLLFGLSAFLPAPCLIHRAAQVVTAGEPAQVLLCGRSRRCSRPAGERHPTTLRRAEALPSGRQLPLHNSTSPAPPAPPQYREEDKEEGGLLRRGSLLREGRTLEEEREALIEQLGEYMQQVRGQKVLS